MTSFTKEIAGGPDQQATNQDFTDFFSFLKFHTLVQDFTDIFNHESINSGYNLKERIDVRLTQTKTNAWSTSFNNSQSIGNDYRKYVIFYYSKVVPIHYDINTIVAFQIHFLVPIDNRLLLLF